MNFQFPTTMMRLCLVVAILAESQILLSGCIPIVVPVPWFPEDPYKDGLEALAKQSAVSRDQIIQNWGKPWAAINDNNFIYIRDKPSSKVFAGYIVYGGGGDGTVETMSYRDYILSFYFDNQGMMQQFETYADTGKHKYCFANDVCFSKETRNVPLSPAWMDREAKQFLASTDECTLYFYRQPYEDGASYKEYVDIQIEQIPNFGLKYPSSIGSSVPGGFFRWQLQAGYSYELTTDFTIIESYPFTTNFIHKKRPGMSINILCEPGGMIYIGLMVPNRKDIPAKLVISKAQPAQKIIKQLRLLAGRYLPQI